MVIGKYIINIKLDGICVMCIQYVQCMVTWYKNAEVKNMIVIIITIIFTARTAWTSKWASRTNYVLETRLRREKGISVREKWDEIGVKIKYKIYDDV